MRKFLRSFYYAGKGLYQVILQERNFRFHLCAAVYVYVFSLFYSFSRVEYCVLTILVGGVLAFELANSALERAVGPPPLNKEPDRRLAQSKDMAAGAVLVFAVAAAVCGIFLFWNIPVFAQICSFFVHNIITLVVFLLSLVASYWFIFCFGKKNNT